MHKLLFILAAAILILEIVIDPEFGLWLCIGLAGFVMGLIVADIGLEKTLSKETKK